MTNKHGHEATEWLRQRLTYDPITGVVTWSDGQRAGLPAGTLMRGYWRLQTHPAKHTYLLHRVAWMLHYGGWPDGHLDHIDCDRGNNRIANLRIVTRSENLQNVMRANKKNQSGLLGAHRSNGRWCSRIGIGGREYLYLGMFDTPEAAHTAYMEAKKRLHIEQPTLARPQPTEQTP